jgi:uncharacterized alpha-E superfamily protein
MLSRIANNLFWMGRYLERAEHLAQYIKIQYLSSLDAPLAYNKEQALDSILYMNGGKTEYDELYEKLDDDEVLFYTTFDERNQLSIKNCIRMARENARGGRDELASEAWEAINRLYHYTNNFRASHFPQEKRYEFYQSISDNTYIIKGTLRTTHLVNPVLAMINVGLHIERSVQICHIILAKLRDIQQTVLETDQESVSLLENYHAGNMLRSAGGFDMSRKYYKTLPNKHNAIEFLVLNKSFPRSISYNLERIERNMEVINDSKKFSKDSARFKVGRLNAHLRYMTIEEIEQKEIIFLNELTQALYDIGQKFDEEYLNF